MKSSTRRIQYMVKYDVGEILTNISVQIYGYKQDLDICGLKTTELVELIEFLVNETSKLKSILLEIPKDEEIQ